MANSNSAFQPSQGSSSVSADDSLQFLEDHGFFYEEDEEIGMLVKEIYRTGRIRSEDTRLDHFRPRLEQNPVSRTKIVFANCYLPS